MLGVGLVDSSSAVFNEAEMPISTGFRQMAEGNVFLQNTMRFAPTVPSLGGGQARYNPSPMVNSIFACFFIFIYGENLLSGGLS